MKTAGEQCFFWILFFYLFVESFRHAEGPHTYRVYRFFRDIFENFSKKIGIPIFKILAVKQSDQFEDLTSILVLQSSAWQQFWFLHLVHHVRPGCLFHEG